MNVVQTISNYLEIEESDVKDQLVNLSLSEVVDLLQAIRDDNYKKAFNIITGSAI